MHPEVTSPADCTRELTAEAVSFVCQWHGGDWRSIDPVHVKSRGQILAPSTRAGCISILRVFFRDLQEWDLIPRRFDPMRSMVTPKSLLALIGPNPPDGRIIAEIKDDKFVVNQNNYLEMEQKNKSNLVIRDQYGRTVLDVTYINPTAVKISSLVVYTPKRGPNGNCV